MGYVYLIGSKAFGWYKIGKSKTPEVRVSTLGVLLPFKVEVLGVWQATDHDRAERLLHETYAASRINGEWFEFSHKQVEALMGSLPAEARITSEVLTRFSNVDQDRQGDRKVLGLKTQRQRGDYTDEEREAMRLEGARQSKARREAKALAKADNTAEYRAQALMEARQLRLF